MTDVTHAVRTVLVDCLGLRAGEEVVVVCDPERRHLAGMLVEGARALEAEALLIEMSERQTHGTEPPASVTAAMVSCDVLIAPTTKSLSHTEARKAASDVGVRVASMPQITQDMLERTMSADYGAIARRSRAVADALTEGSEVTVTTPGGTDLTLSIEGRQGLSDDGKLTTPGAFGNLPAGEGFIAPVEGRTQGRLAIDGTIATVGRLQDPLVVEIEDGYAARFSGSAASTFRGLLEPHGPEAFAVAELGIGTNEKARLTGNVLEDEKIAGTIHIAFGDNHSFGGATRVPSHQDGIVLDPTLMVDGRTLVQHGRLLV